MPDLHGQEREALKAALGVMEQAVSEMGPAARTQNSMLIGERADDMIAAMRPCIRKAEAALAAREEPPTSRERKLQDALADALLWLERIPPPEEEIRALGRGLWDETLENARAFLAAREDTERPDAICGVVCAAGPNGEPLACGYRRNHDGTHSWASLPTWTDRWRIVHQPHRDPKKASLAIEGPPCGSQVVYGVAMDRGIPAHERVRDTEREKR